MTSKADDARVVVEALGKRSPDALKLARAVSLASRVEPELLRKVRLELLPDLDAGAEADVWFSPLVQSTSPLAFSFLPAVADQLRRELAESRDSLTRAWQVLSDVHEHSPAAIKLEERVTWTILNNGPAAHDDVEKELMSVVSAILTQNRTGLARWALRAVPRLPVEARQTKAAQTLLITAAAHLGAWHMLQKQVENNNLPATFINDLKVVLPSNLQQVEVGVRLLESDELGLTADQRGYVVEFSDPPLSDQSDLIRVPGTVPLLLEVSWSENRPGQVKQLSLYRGRVETIRVGSSPVTIRTARGDVYTLSEEKNARNPIDLRQLALERIPRAPSIGYVQRTNRAGDVVDIMVRRLRSDRMPVFQLSGEAGVGKTVTAAEVARRLITVYRHQVVWISVEGRRDFDLSNLLDEIFAQLGRAELRTVSLKAKQYEAHALMSVVRPTIFIDSFQVIDKKAQIACLRFLRSSACPYVVITRDRTRKLEGPPLLVLDTMLVSEAEQFLKRIISQNPDSKILKELNLFETMDVCGRNPLAMQMLLAQIEFTGNPQEAFKRLHKFDSSLDSIVRDSIDLPELGADGRAALIAISLFVPGASKTALAEVAGFGNEIERLDEITKPLTTLKLIWKIAEGSRLAVHSFVREYLYRRLRLLLGDRKWSDLQFRRRFVDYFWRYAEEHAEATSTDYDSLEAEFQNLRIAMDFGLQAEQWDKVIRICLALNGFLDVRGYWDEALRQIELALKAAQKATRPDVFPQLHLAAGDIYLRRDEFNMAEKAFRAVLTHYGDTVNFDIARATRRLGSIAVERENLTKAKRLYSQSLEISRQLHIHSGIADNLHNLAIVAQIEGKLDEAMRLYDESLRLSERVGDQRSIAISLHQLGVVSREQGKYEQARNFFERSLSIKRSLGFRDGMADTLHQLGLMFQALGDKAQALHAFKQAITIYEELSSPSAAAAAADLAAVSTPARVAKPRRPRAKKTTKSPAKESAAKKGAAKKRRLGINSVFRRSAPPKRGGRMGGRFGPRSRKSFR